MSIWRAKFTSYDGKTVYTANLSLEERKHGMAKCLRPGEPRISGSMISGATARMNNTNPNV